MVLTQAAKLTCHDIPSPVNLSVTMSSLRAKLAQLGKELIDFIFTLYLFTRADISTFLVPTILFAAFGAVSNAPLSTNDSASIIALITRLPSMIILVLSNLLIFNIANQRFPDAVLEDSLNKPSRPLPSGRITTTQARRLLLFSIPTVLALSIYLGPWQETLLLFSSNWVYNDLKACDEHFILRNLLIAIGYGLYNCATLRLAYGPNTSLTTFGVAWVVLVGCVIFTTQHICDLKDQAGDKVRGRQTAPIVLGDGVARWTVAIPVIFWSIFCPYFFGIGFWGYVIPINVGLIVALRTVVLTKFEDDVLTWKLWAAWTAVIFSLPLIKDPAVVTTGLKCIVGGFSAESGCSGPLNLVGVSSMAALVKSKRLRGAVFRTNFSGNNTLDVGARMSRKTI